MSQDVCGMGCVCVCVCLCDSALEVGAKSGRGEKAGSNIEIMMGRGRYSGNLKAGCT